MPGICNRCGRKVFAAEENLALDRSWHLECYTCAICNRAVNSTTISECKERNEIYCKGCYRHFIGPQGYGYGLQPTLLVYEPSINYDGNGQDVDLSLPAPSLNVYQNKAPEDPSKIPPPPSRLGRVYNNIGPMPSHYEHHTSLQKPITAKGHQQHQEQRYPQSFPVPPIQSHSTSRNLVYSQGSTPRPHQSAAVTKILTQKSSGILSSINQQSFRNSGPSSNHQSLRNSGIIQSSNHQSIRNSGIIPSPNHQSFRNSGIITSPNHQNFYGGGKTVETPAVPRYPPKPPSYTRRQLHADSYDTKNSSGTLCNRCKRPVFLAEMQRSSYGVYHTECFICCSCGSPLDPKTVNENQGELFCKGCYRRNYGLHGCGYGIGAGALQTL